MSVRVEIIGLENVLRRFKESGGIVADEMEDALDTAFSRIIPRLAAYPSPPTNSRYRRTYKLKAGWTNTDRKFIVRGAEIRAALQNPVSYVDLVQGDNQAAVHAGRWKTVTEIVTESRGDVLQAMGTGIQAVAKRLAS